MNVRVNIDYNTCIGCKQCLRSCTFGVFEWLDDLPIVANPIVCSFCRDCLKRCPVKAIDITVT